MENSDLFRHPVRTIFLGVSLAMLSVGCVAGALVLIIVNFPDY
jgi:spore coat protein CotH